jgi:hypothetical protein
MTMLAERAECSNVAVKQAGTFESTLSPDHMLLLIFQTGFVVIDLAQPDV